MLYNLFNETLTHYYMRDVHLMGNNHRNMLIELEYHYFEEIGKDFGCKLK